MTDRQTEGRPLSPREAAFVAHVVGGQSYADAARLAGYSDKSAKNQGYQLTRKPRIAAAIAAQKGAVEAQAAAATASVIGTAAEQAAYKAVTEREVVETFRTIRDRALGAGDLAVARAANRDLGDSIGMFKQKVEHSGSIGTPPSRLTEPERAAMLRSFFEAREN